MNQMDTWDPFSWLAGPSIAAEDVSSSKNGGEPVSVLRADE